MWRAWKRAGWGRLAITQGSCRGVPSLPYLVMSTRSKTSVREATGWPAGVRKLRIPPPGARGQGLWGGGVGGHHGGGQAGGKGDLRRLGVDADGEPGGGGMVPPSKQAPRIGTMSCRRRAMSGALREAVAMLVRGQRVAVTIRVSRAARDPSRRGPPPQDRRGGWGRGDRSAPSAAPDEAVLRC
jgi:hypothetical protein